MRKKICTSPSLREKSGYLRDRSMVPLSRNMLFSAPCLRGKNYCFRPPRTYLDVSGSNTSSEGDWRGWAGWGRGWYPELTISRDGLKSAPVPPPEHAPDPSAFGARPTPSAFGAQPQPKCNRSTANKPSAFGARPPPSVMWARRHTKCFQSTAKRQVLSEHSFNPSAFGALACHAHADVGRSSLTNVKVS